MQTVDVDSIAGSFEPVLVKFRGAEHVLGASALSLLKAIDVAKGKGEGLEADYAALRPMLAELAPGLPTEDLNAIEELALFGAVSKLIAQVAQVRFRPPEQP